MRDKAVNSCGHQATRVFTRHGRFLAPYADPSRAVLGLAGLESLGR